MTMTLEDLELLSVADVAACMACVSGVVRLRWHGPPPLAHSSDTIDRPVVAVNVVAVVVVLILQNSQEHTAYEQSEASSNIQ